MVPPRKASYRSDLFDASMLTSTEAVDNAAFEFQTIVNDANIERIVDEVMLHERPEVLRLVLSCVDDELIMDHFPTAADAFGASVISEILSRLSTFFLFVPVATFHEHHHQLVKDAPDVLAAIIAKLVDDPDADSVSGGRKISQKKAKLARRVAAQSKNIMDPAPFERLGIPVPETRCELEQAVEIVLATQRSVLKMYLESLRLPTVCASVKAACIRPEERAVSESAEDSSEAGGNAEHARPNNDAAPAPVYATFQPKKFSTLYRRRAAGFGEWIVTIAPRAERDLRDYNRRGRKTFTAIVKKMRDLSNGDFSPDNYQQLNGGDVEIPIYEAKITEDLKLVYQIDCIPQHDSKTEQQALKVFGIYENEQLSRGSFWASLSRELGKKGEEYKDRCTLRQPGRLDPTECMFMPATFPAREDVRLSGGVPDLPSNDAEQIQSLLLKTVHFSQPLLESIIADLDVAFVLEISPKELEIIEHPQSCYVLGRSGTGKTTTMLYKMLLVETSDSSAPESVRSRQLFVTQSRILAEKVGQHFAKLLGGHRPSSISQNLKAATKADRALATDEDRDWRSDLPRKFSDLQDADFPLFVSLDQLYTMIENDMPLSTQTGATNLSRLTWDKFRSEYWPHFPQSMCKGFEPSMVFSELMGVIMGSEKALTSKSRFLDREAYLNLGERGQSTFADQRERIYDLFEKYLVQKRRLGDVDAADRALLILEFFKSNGVPGKKVDYLYVDETQDNILVDTLVLRSLCYNPNGLFWAGDTAQTISAGSSFRFNELKAFLHRIEGRRRTKEIELGFQPPAPPRQFQLTVNYRSHSGIVNCAHSIIEVITKLWPNAIDVLDRERGTVDGLRPIFFTNWDAENVQSKQFLFGEQSSGGYIELGAYQCILVRNESAKKSLQAQVGDIGLIMTLYESKGLEFNDVLLYNFFEDSNTSEGQWRVVLNTMEGRTSGSAPAPAFDGMRHASVCTELKFLYVAITRARNNIWIADCSSKGEPMRTLWTSKDQVQNCVLGTDTPRFAISSTPAEWREQGDKLFENNRFSQARLCYERAFRPLEAAVARACDLRQEAHGMPNNVRREIIARKAKFSEAASAFIACANQNGEDAAVGYFRSAGKCFEQGGEIARAIDAYIKARHFNRVAELYRTLGKFDEAIATIRNEKIDHDIAEKITSVARLFYFKKGQLEKAVELFERHEEALEYLEDRGLNPERATLLESFAQLSDAAEIHLSEGRTSRAIELFIQDHNTARACACILQGLWERFSFAVVPTQDSSVTHLLELAAQVDMSSTESPSTRDEISMFRAITTQAKQQLLLLSKSFLSTENPAMALMCSDHCFVNPPKIQTLPVHAVAENLQVFYTYVKLLYQFAFHIDPCSSSVLEKIFGYRKDGENHYSVSQGTFLHLDLSAVRFPDADGNILLTGSELRSVFQKSLRGRLAKRVREENEMCRVARAFEGPCLTFALFNGYCNRGNCPQEHVYASAFTPQEYNLRIRIHLQQILIYQTLHSIEQHHAERRRWISRLYAVLNPPSFHLGSAASLDLNSIPEAELALQVVKEWVRNWSFALEFSPETHFLTDMIQLARLGFELDRKHATVYSSRFSFMMDPRKPLIYRRPPEGRYIVGEFLSALDDRYEWCLSAGVIFLQHIINKNLSIHVNVLCDVAEHLCAGLVVADRQRQGPIHDLTLPLSWFVRRFSGAGEVGGYRETNTCWLLARSLAELLEPVYSGVGADYLLFKSKNLANPTLGYMIRNIILARICRCMCLLAYNLRNHRLRDEVLNWITSLRRRDPTRHFSGLCLKYVDASSWTSLTRAVRSSTEGSPQDEMVQLLYAPRHQPPELRGVRQIVYQQFDDIPRLLGSVPSIASTESISVDEREAARVVPLIQNAQTDDVREDHDADSDERRLPENVAIDVPVVEPVARSEEELTTAAKIRKGILQAHHRVKQRKQGASKPSLAAGLSEIFTECMAASSTIDRRHRLYRVYFLGPLPHLLLCLDIVRTRAQKEAKQIAATEYKTAEHEALEILDQKLKDLQRTRKEVIELQKALKPAAGIHPERNLHNLKEKAGEAVSLLKGLPFATPPGLEAHINIAYKGFVQPWTTTTHRTKPKPSLNTEEEVY